MVDKYDWHIVPLVNPDGYNYSMTNVSHHCMQTCQRAFGPLYNTPHIVLMFPCRIVSGEKTEERILDLFVSVLISTETGEKALEVH